MAQYNSIDEINAITIDDVIIELMSRLVDLSLIPIGTNFYNLLPDEGQSLYERIQIHILLEKPSLEELESELIIYKVELVNNFDVNAAERERVEALEARIAALADLRLCMVEAGFNNPNAKLFVSKIIQHDDIEALEALEAVNQTVIDYLAAQDDVELQKELAIQAVKDIDATDINAGNADEILSKVVVFLQKTI